eukprot:351209-Chlamydomonas_euryale.AAC.3
MMVALYDVPVDVWGSCVKQMTGTLSHPHLRMCGGSCEANDWHTVPSSPPDDVRVAIRFARPIASQHFQPVPPEIQGLLQYQEVCASPKLSNKRIMDVCFVECRLLSASRRLRLKTQNTQISELGLQRQNKQRGMQSSQGSTPDGQSPN